MGKRKDRFWEYVEELEDGFICNYCGRKFSGGIPRIKPHLARLTGHGIDICEEVPEDVRATAFSEIDGVCKKSKTKVTSNCLEAHQICSTSSDNLSKIRERDKNMADKKLLKFIVSNNIPLDVVEAQCFADFVRSVAELGPDYTLPSTLTLKTKLIPDLEMEVEAHLKNVKESWDKTGCTIMVDRFCDFATVFATVFAFSPKGLVFVNLYNMSKANTSLQGLVSSVIENIGADRVVQLITKNDEMPYKFEDTIISRYPSLYNIPCVAHKIHILLYDIYFDVSWVREIIGSAMLAVKYMYEDGTVLSLMRKYTNNKELKHQTCKHKFTHYQMLRSLFDNKDELWQLVSSTEWTALEFNRNNVQAREVQILLEGMEFWNQVKEVLETLEPIIEVLRLVEDDRPTSGYLYEAMHQAKEAILQQYNNDKCKHAKILEIFEKEESIIIHPIHAAAAFLNPAYMCRKNFKENQKMKRGMSFVLENLVADGERKDFMRDLQQYRHKISELFTEMAMEMLETSHPWAWWDYCGDCLPVLQKYAIRILSQNCKCSCEHKYTAFEVAQTKDIRGAAPKLQDNLVFKTVNTMMMEKFKSLEANCLEPIDLGKCNELPDYVDPFQVKAVFFRNGENESAAHFAFEKLRMQKRRIKVSWINIRSVFRWCSCVQRTAAERWAESVTL